MSSKLQDSIILISSGTPNNRSFGTGFVIHRDEQATYLLTCAHVVRDVGGADQVEADGSRATVIASGEASGVDLAVLRVEALFDKPVLGLHLSGEKGSPFITAGYQSFDKGFLIREIRGNLAGQTGFKYRGQTNRIRTWDLKTIDEYYLQPGCSGSPVVDESSGYVLGIVSHRIGETEKGVAISIEALETVWKELPFELSKGKVDQTSEYMQTSQTIRDIKVFICYSDEDEKLRKRLEETCLSSWEGERIIKVWHKGKMLGGQKIKVEIDKNLGLARLILLIISPNFMNSYYRNYQDIKSQIEYAIERQKTGKVDIIPVLIEKCANWNRASFGDFNPLPKNRKFVTDRY